MPAPSVSQPTELPVASEVPIADLPLSNRTRARLSEAGIGTTSEIERLSDDQLLALRGFGHTCLREIRALLRSFGDGEGAPATSPGDSRFPSRVGEAVRALHIDRLPISNRARRVFRREEIVTVGDYIARGREPLLALRNFGDTSFRAVNRAVHAAARSLDEGSGADRFHDPETLTAGPQLDRKFARMPVSALDLPRRARRACAEMHIRTLADLARLTSQDLLHRKNFGQATLRRIQAEMERFIASQDHAAHTTFGELLGALLGRLQPKERQLVELREGKHAAPRTLTCAGEAMEITESRACQIEHAAWAKLRRFAVGVTDEAADRAGSRLLARGGVAPADTLAEDSYFSPLDMSTEFIGRMLARLLPHRVARLADGRLAAVPGATLATLSARLRKRLNRSGESLPLAALTQEVLRGLELETEPTVLVRALCEVLFHREVALSPDGVEVVRTASQGMSDDLRRVLLDSEVPMHFSEITRRLNLPPYLRTELTEEKVRLRLCRDERFVLIRRGLYDVRERFSLADDEREALAVNALATLQREGRPTSVSLVSQALRAEPRFHELSEFVLAQVMREDARFTNLGRGTFVPAGADAPKILHVSEILVEVLERANGPQEYAELRRQVQAVRRVSDGAISATLVGRDTFVRVARGVFDLASRHPFDAAERRRIAAGARRELATRGGAASLEELLSALSWKTTPPSAILLGDLLRRQGGFKSLGGGYIAIDDSSIETDLGTRAAHVLAGSEPLRPSTIARRLGVGGGILALLRHVLKDDGRFVAATEGRFDLR